MIILSHRGYWKSPQEKNSFQAFERSFKLNFGTETDLRDRMNELVVAHDPPDASAIYADLLFSTYAKHDNDLPLALNIKSDGLQEKTFSLIKKYQIENYFAFDMSVPDMIGYIRLGINVFTRQSDFEETPILYDRSCGVWLDSFETNWFHEDIIRSHLSNGKRVCIVSSELHKRPFEEDWSALKKMSVIGSPDVMLCTDHPELARSFFNE